MVALPAKQICEVCTEWRLVVVNGTMLGETLIQRVRITYVDGTEELKWLESVRPQPVIPGEADSCAA